MNIQQRRTFMVRSANVLALSLSEALTLILLPLPPFSSFLFFFLPLGSTPFSLLFPLLGQRLFFSRRLDLRPFYGHEEKAKRRTRRALFSQLFPSELLCSTTILLSIAFFSSFPPFSFFLPPLSFLLFSKAYSFSPCDHRVNTSRHDLNHHTYICSLAPKEISRKGDEKE